ncbi:DUF4276 family protein [Candidatus Poribacteria bacterium]|nr:DUF4276 family protein [Candidatus Poribacteria bacterium]MYG05400.1 DUF4276 family protein [Candidatus Poribacteria bacterium]MYK23782.1 DUF4276 family protein [Candidatus Poribacteria bacterium]
MLYRLLNVSCGGTLMRNTNLFVEDVAHEDFLTALIQRLADAHNIEINITASSVRGGHGKVIMELKQYLRDLQHYKEGLPDLIIVGTDSNCKGLSERETEINQVTSDLSDLVISMVPEPHIERWLLLDSEAFKTVFGKGCSVPDQKCERGRYKNMLLNAIYQATMVFPLEAIEHVEELVNEMNLQRVAQMDRSIDRLLSALQRQFRIWQQTED